MPPSDHPIALAKARLRAGAETARQSAYDADPASAAALARHGLAALGQRVFEVASGYWPIRSEIDPRPLLRALTTGPRRAALPAVLGRSQPLEFREWDSAVPLAPGPFGTLHPFDGSPVLLPQLLLVPLLAFDDRRHRLGYGAGFYDRTLAALRANGPVLAVGVAFAAQRVDEVPVDSWDEPLDLVLTERGVV